MLPQWIPSDVMKGWAVHFPFAHKAMVDYISPEALPNKCIRAHSGLARLTRPWNKETRACVRKTGIQTHRHGIQGMTKDCVVVVLIAGWTRKMIFRRI